jgi:hypothetical protein
MQHPRQQQQQQQHPRQQQQHPRQQQQRAPSAPADASTLVARAVTSALNKVNQRNFAAVVGALTRLVQTQRLTAAELVAAVMQKSTADGGSSSYVKVYAQLLAETARADAGAADAIGARVEEELRSLWADIEASARATAAVGARVVTQSSQDYDAFCAAVKRRRGVLGRLQLAVALAAARLVDAAHVAAAVEHALDRVTDAVLRLGEPCAADADAHFAEAATSMCVDAAAHLGSAAAALRPRIASLAAAVARVPALAASPLRFKLSPAPMVAAAAGARRP